MIPDIRIFNGIKIIDRNLILTNNELCTILITIIFDMLEKDNTYYPKFREWLNTKVLTGLYNGTRSILIKWSNDHISGISIIKHTAIEKKICCLRIFNNYQNKGYGIQLFKNSMNLLETDKPLLTLNQNKLIVFDKIFNYFNFSLEKTYKDIYRKHNCELSFNGELIDN